VYGEDYSCYMHTDTHTHTHTNIHDMKEKKRTNTYKRAIRVEFAKCTTRSPLFTISRE